MIKWKTGKYLVTRFCCTSGMCITCRGAGDRSKRKRIVQTDHVSKAWALHVCEAWGPYDPVVDRMPSRRLTKVSVFTPEHRQV